MTILNLLASAASDSFVRLFTEMNAWTIGLFVLGIIFCAIEMFVPGFGFFGISGTVMIIVGIIVRMICGGDLYMLLYMILISLVLFILAFWVISQVITKGRLSKTALFHVDSAVPVGNTEGTRDFSYLVGKSGVALTPLRPVGRAKFEEETIDVIARDGFIASNAKLTVVETEGSRVVVIEIKED
ncbi:MAG: hypothetical protein J1F66_02415 [Clostridiales bacterium]|nr:hypothetical protein [Clostridiales bacterium]